MRAGIAIVGGGVMGVSIALHAAKRTDPLGSPVVLVERRNLAAGSSGRSGAILRQHYSDRATAAMARDSLREYAGFLGRTGRDIGFQRTGVLTLAGPKHPEHIGLVERNVEMLRSIAIDTRLLRASEIRALIPGICVADGTVGAYEPGGGFVDPIRTVEAMAAIARSSGATTRVGNAVTKLVVRSGKAFGVETDAGTIEADRVVVAAGPWTGRLFADIGVALPLRAVRPEQHFVAMAPVAPTSPEVQSRVENGDRWETVRFGGAREPAKAAAHPILLDLELGHYTKCEPASDRTRIGRMDYSQDATLDDPDDLDENVSDSFRRGAREALCARMPVYEGMPDTGAEAAWFTLTPDAQAIMGPVPGIEGLYVVSGFSGHGFKLAPSVGEGMAQMLFGEPVSAFDTDFFSADRFAGTNASPVRGRFGL